MKILVLSRYSRKGASSRYRMFQYYPYLEDHGVELQTEPLFGDEYLDKLYSRQSRLGSVIISYLRRIWMFLKFPAADLLWIEKELFPWMPWWFERLFLCLLGKPYVIEYDDAIFHQYDKHRLGVVRLFMGRKCDALMAHSNCVIVGNDYLGDRARKAGAKSVVQIPTVVSSEIFKPEVSSNSVPVIGWIGSMSTAVYLEGLRPALVSLAKKYKFVLRVVGARLDWPELSVENVPWSEAKEVALIQSFDIGVMPLVDSPWERGKCGFKLIQYMACGKPVVADPVGVNNEIVQEGENGFLTSPARDWSQSLEPLIVDASLRATMGRRGHERFLTEYSMERWQPTLLEVLKASARTEEP